MQPSSQVLPIVSAYFDMLNCSIKTQAPIHRRAMLWRCLSLLGLCCPTVSGSPAPDARYRRLESPVVLPLEEVAESWRPFPFSALASAPEPTGGPSSDILLKGIVLRLPRPTGSSTELKAFCLHCPHELCFVNFTEHPELVRAAPGVKVDHPLLVCPCHFSVFDPLADGDRISGPADRGLYRFRLQIRQSALAIVEVEEEALG